MGFLNRLLTKCLLRLIHIYRIAFSPLLPARCRFYPTCSSYALEAVSKYGGFIGGQLALRRICRCHPWGGSGIDFVPLLLKYHHFTYVSQTLKHPMPYR